jgi:hypothetical protein
VSGRTKPPPAGIIATLAIVNVIGGSVVMLTDANPFWMKVAGFLAAVVGATTLLILNTAANRRLGPDHCRLHGMKHDEQGCAVCRSVMEPPR